MNLSSYVTERTNSQYYQVRLTVPKRLRPIIGKWEFYKSLKTTNRRDAERLAFPYITDCLRQIDQAERAMRGASAPLPTPTTGVDFGALIVDGGHDKVADALVRQAADAARTGPAALAEFKARLRDHIETFNGKLLARDLAYWGRIATRALSKREVAFDEVNSQHVEFAFDFGRAFIDAHRKALAVIEGREQDYTPSTVTTEYRNKATAKAKPRETILALFEEYAAECIAQDSKRPDTVNQDRNVIELFADFVGRERAIRTISRTDIAEWRRALSNLPPKFRFKKGYEGLTIREAAEKAKAEGVPALSPTTINKYLSTVSPFLDWCVRFEKADANPCRGLFFDLKKGRNRRPPFTIDQLNRILSSPLFTGFEADGKEHLPGSRKADDWRFWVPLICMFTGARISEIAQLRVDDVKEQHGIWFFHIRDDEKTGQRTKSRQSRPAAVHSRLISIGLLDFVRAQKERASQDGNQQLFPELEPNARGHIGATPSRFWRDYLESIGVKEGRDGYGAHSFRHTIADQLRLADYLDSEFQAALGHSQKTVTSGYGQLTQGTAKRFSEIIEKVTFEGVNFSHLTKPR